MVLLKAQVVTRDPLMDEMGYDRAPERALWTLFDSHHGTLGVHTRPPFGENLNSASATLVRPRKSLRERIGLPAPHTSRPVPPRTSPSRRRRRNDGRDGGE